ncbi:hypothetical protein L6452_14915 [Arctium lappa]|uniref:Uncharacterized protein n=1 Tax=Arctium lappa TaxID=4217 RepID=A0ACB9CM72_ARCLA|nr:hypothetical protein L6452_14915 [Arctium lappa]
MFTEISSVGILLVNVLIKCLSFIPILLDSVVAHITCEHQSSFKSFPNSIIWGPASCLACARPKTTSEVVENFC